MKYPLILVALMNVAAFAAEERPLPAAHTTRNIEGWTVRVDDCLLCGDGAAVGERALKLLASRLVAITFVVPEESLAKLRTITSELGLDYGDVRAMQYHPDAGSPREHGYSEQLAKCVHIPEVADFLEPEGIHSQPWVVLHELAHGFHDQVVGFDDPRVTAAWKKFCDGGKYKSVLTTSGKMHEHYGLTDPKEFFAEMTECCFGTNDFYPFVSGELQRAEPETFALLAEIWGPLPADIGLSTSRVKLELDGLTPEEAASITVNGAHAGGFIGKPFRLDVTRLLKSGSNTIRIEPSSPRSAKLMVY